MVVVIELRPSELVYCGSERNNNCSRLHRSGNRPKHVQIKRARPRRTPSRAETTPRRRGRTTSRRQALIRDHDALHARCVDFESKVARDLLIGRRTL